MLDNKNNYSSPIVYFSRSSRHQSPIIYKKNRDKVIEKKFRKTS